MISKISYIKLIRETYGTEDGSPPFRRPVISFNACLHTDYLDSYSEDPEVLKSSRIHFPDSLTDNNSAFLIILIGILAFAVGISGFQFMHKKEKLDFYPLDLRSNVISCSQSLIWQDCSSFSSHI